MFTYMSLWKCGVMIKNNMLQCTWLYIEIGEAKFLFVQRMWGIDSWLSYRGVFPFIFHSSCEHTTLPICYKECDVKIFTYTFLIRNAFVNNMQPSCILGLIKETWHEDFRCITHCPKIQETFSLQLWITLHFHFAMKGAI